MQIFYLPKFVRQYKKLPDNIKNEAEIKENIFRKNPFDKKLKTHKLHGPLKNYYSFSINIKYRIIFNFNNNGDVRFYAVGDHDVYEN